MRSPRVFALLIAACLASPFSVSEAGLDLDAPLPKGEGFELVVMEAPGCIYCDLFRRDVLPTFQSSERGREMPVRFVDLNDEAAEKLATDGPVDVVPTFLIMKNQREIGRIPGYVGPEFFFHSINHVISSAP